MNKTRLPGFLGVTLVMSHNLFSESYYLWREAGSRQVRSRREASKEGRGGGVGVSGRENGTIGVCEARDLIPKLHST